MDKLLRIRMPGILITLVLLLMDHATAQFPFPPPNNNNNNNNDNDRFANNSLDNGNPFLNRDRDRDSLERDRDRDRDRDIPPFLRNQGNNQGRNPFAPTQPPPLFPPPSFDTNQNFPPFQPAPTPSRPDIFNPFGVRRDTPFAQPPIRYDPSDRSYYSPGVGEDDMEKQCPQGWDLFSSRSQPQSLSSGSTSGSQSCYRFVTAGTRNWLEAQRNCQNWLSGGNLVSLNGLEEHGWIVRKLLAKDPGHRTWYISARQIAPNIWTNGDGSQLVDMDQAFLQDQMPTYNVQGEVYNYLAYNFSDQRSMWGLLKVTGQEPQHYICEVPLDQVPFIQVDNRDFEYGIDILDPKKIPRGPYFIKEPKDEVFDISRAVPLSYVTLTCVAGGWPAPSYRWFREEYQKNTLISIPIDPLKESKYTVSGGSLIIHEPHQREDRGSYHCIASNQFGSIISETVAVSFGYIAEFILVRTIEYANQFWGKAIYCDPPQHFPAVHYYWSRTYFPNFLEEDQRVFVSNDGNLYISAVDISDSGKYSCNVQSTTSDSGRNGPFFLLQVVPHGNPQQLKFPNNFPKVFPEAPKAGDLVRLECVAFGYPVPSYNWTRKGSGLPRNAILSNYNRVILIKNVTFEDQGEYICRASNSRLSIESSVTLSIQAAPHFIVPLEDRHMDKDSDLSWTCEAYGIPEDVSYQWYRNGILLAPETLPVQDIGRYFIQDNVLTITKLDEERDAGMYQCRANNSLAAKFSSAQLRVLLLRPSFKKRPVDPEILAMENGNVTIRCDPEAAPRPRFQWRKDGNLIGSGGRRQILPNGNLQIMPVSREDHGIYTCIATNIRGSDESTGRLSVLRGPLLLEQLPDRVQYVVGSQLSLRCRADADPSLDISYIWRHNGLRIDPSEPHYEQRVRMDSRFGYLEIFNLSLSDRGDYECEVLSWVGRLNSLTRVEMRGPPGPAGGVEAFDLSSKNATIRWTDGASNGEAPYMYTIQGRTQWDKDFETLVTNVTAFDADRTLGPRIGENLRKELRVVNVLSPWCTYEFRVIAANSFGYGEPSAPSPQYNTLPSIPEMPPRKVGGGGGKTNTLTITWDPLPPKDQNAPGIHYKIFWRRYREDIVEEYQFLKLEKWGNIGSYAVSIPSNYYYTLYEVIIQPWNDFGYGPLSTPVRIYTAEDMPQAIPTVVTPIPYNSTAINVTWAPVEESREKIRGELLGYRIRYWLRKGNNLYDAEALNYLSRSRQPNALIVGLIPNTYYWVQVMAYNSAGPGPASEPIYERTLKKAPQKPPTSVVVQALDPSTITVTWRYVAPSTDEEALTGYKVRIWEADQDVSKANDTYVLIGSRKLETTIGDLQPGKMYVLRVLAFSRGGDGKMSSPAKEFILGDPEALRSSSGKFHETLAYRWIIVIGVISLSLNLNSMMMITPYSIT